MPIIITQTSDTNANKGWWKPQLISQTELRLLNSSWVMCSVVLLPFSLIYR